MWFSHVDHNLRWTSEDFEYFRSLWVTMQNLYKTSIIQPQSFNLTIHIDK